MPPKRTTAPLPERLGVFDVDETKLARIKSAFEVLAVVGGALAIVIPALGHVALRHRSRLLGLPDGFLEYEPVDVAITGTVVVWEGFVRAVASLLATDSLVRLAWLIVACIVAGSLVRLRSAALSRGVIVFSAIAIYFASAILFEGIKAGGRATNLSSIFAQATFEMQSWLENKGNAGRRELAAGLISWLLVWCVLALRWSWVHAKASAQYLDKLFVGVLSIELVLLLAMVPQAHAYARWGREYPRVTGIDPGCDSGLVAKLQLLSDGQAWLVSGGASREVLLAALPGSSELTALPLTHPEGGRCAWSAVTLEVIPRTLSAK